MTSADDDAVAVHELRWGGFCGHWGFLGKDSRVEEK